LEIFYLYLYFKSPRDH
jgi:hypothetical protein